jgi:hypothetical protein
MFKWSILQSCKISKWHFFLSRSTQKLKIWEFWNCSLFTTSDMKFDISTQPKIHNISYCFFCTQVESIIIYIPDFFWNFKLSVSKSSKNKLHGASLCSKSTLSPKMILHLMDHRISLGWVSLPNVNDFILMVSAMPNCL